MSPVSPEIEENGSFDSLVNDDFCGDADSMDSMDPITITTTVGSGPNKRKEVMTLPLPPGALPPRKRAKTKDEKEQRRIERIMRNRQAAHASREKKRRHVEDLETKCVVLGNENESLQSQIQALQSNYAHASDHSKFLRSKLSELVDMITTAQSSGNLNSIETGKFLKDVDSNSSSFVPINTSITSTNTSTPLQPSTTPTLIVDDADALSDSGMSLPSLSSSVASSPSTSPLDIMIKSEESDDDHAVISFPEDEYPLFGLLDYRSHHPAAVMCM